jgi:hypothetical protein
VDSRIAVELLGDELGIMKHYKRGDPLQRNRSDPEGSIKNISVDSAQDTTHFENMTEEQQLEELE